jgi:putative transposase
MNPVRARMVDRPSKYRWSSHATNVEGSPSSIVTPHAEYMRLGQTDALRRIAYAQLFETPLPSNELTEIRKAANGGFALGSPAFVDAVESALGRPARRRHAGRPSKTREMNSGQTTIIGI